MQPVVVGATIGRGSGGLEIRDAVIKEPDRGVDDHVIDAALIEHRFVVGGREAIGSVGSVCLGQALDCDASPGGKVGQGVSADVHFQVEGDVVALIAGVVRGHLVSKFRIEIPLPHVLRLEDVAVAVDVFIAFVHVSPPTRLSLSQFFCRGF